VPLPQAAFRRVKEVDTGVGRSSSLSSKLAVPGLCVAMLPGHPDAKQFKEIQRWITTPLELCHSTNLFQTFGFERSLWEDGRVDPCGH